MQSRAHIPQYAKRHSVLLLAVAPLAILFGGFLLFETAFDNCLFLDGLRANLPSLSKAGNFCSSLDEGRLAVKETGDDPFAGTIKRISPIIDAGSRVTWLTAGMLVLLVAIPTLAFIWWSVWKHIGGREILIPVGLTVLIFAGWFVVWQPTLGEPPRLETLVPSNFAALHVFHLHMTADLLHRVDPQFHTFAYRLYMICFGLLVLTVVSGVVAASYALSPLDEKSPQALAQRMQHVKHLLYMGSLLLTVAIVFSGVWLRWPADLLVAEKSVQSELMSLANSVTMYWGAIYTAILLSTYVPGALCLRARARNLATHCLSQQVGDKVEAQGVAPEGAPENGPDLSESTIEGYLGKNGLMLPFAGQLQRVIAIFAPALAGPLISAVTALSNLPS